MQQPRFLSQTFLKLAGAFQSGHGERGILVHQHPSQGGNKYRFCTQIPKYKMLSDKLPLGSISTRRNLHKEGDCMVFSPPLVSNSVFCSAATGHLLTSLNYMQLSVLKDNEQIH